MSPFYFRILLVTSILLLLGNGVVANVVLSKNQRQWLGLDRYCIWLGNGCVCRSVCKFGWQRSPPESCHYHWACHKKPATGAMCQCT
jgi:hypothetical protein